ncbi:MAG: hypothetical protein U9R19_17940 [Bacteroidota bacterium]|nr:hypothetical protein [Bacteroidota bacterium]
MRKVLITAIVTLCLTSINYAQEYKTGIGFRGGLSNGITAKHFLTEKTAIEGILITRWKGLNITGLYEIHKPAFEIDHLYWYYGFGGHIGFWNGDNVSWVNDNVDYTVIGIDGIIGMEYNFREVPISISIDWKPAINIIGYAGFWGDGGALSLRYVF